MKKNFDSADTPSMDDANNTSTLTVNREGKIHEHHEKSMILDTTLRPKLLFAHRNDVPIHLDELARDARQATSGGEIVMGRKKDKGISFKLKNSSAKVTYHGLDVSIKRKPSRIDIRVLRLLGQFFSVQATATIQAPRPRQADDLLADHIAEPQEMPTAEMPDQIWAEHAMEVVERALMTIYPKSEVLIKAVNERIAIGVYGPRKWVLILDCMDDGFSASFPDGFDLSNDFLLPIRRFIFHDRSKRSGECDIGLRFNQGTICVGTA